MAGLGPATHVLGPSRVKTWIPGTSPGMTVRGLERVGSQFTSQRQTSLPLVGESWRGGVSANLSDSGASTPSLALPHKEGGE